MPSSYVPRLRRCPSAIQDFLRVLIGDGPVGWGPCVRSRDIASIDRLPVSALPGRLIRGLLFTPILILKIIFFHVLVEQFLLRRLEKFGSGVDGLPGPGTSQGLARLLTCLKIILGQAVLLHELLQPWAVHITGIEFPVKDELGVLGLAGAIRR